MGLERIVNVASIELKEVEKLNNTVLRWLSPRHTSGLPYSAFTLPSPHRLELTKDMKEKMRMCSRSSLSLIRTPRSRNQELLASFLSCDHGLRVAEGLSSRVIRWVQGWRKNRTTIFQLHLELLPQNAVCSQTLGYAGSVMGQSYYYRKH